MNERRIFELTTQLKKAGHYELAHFLIGQYATAHVSYAPTMVTVTILTDAHLGHELLEIRSRADDELAEVVPLATVDTTWLYYMMTYGHLKSERRNGRSWGVAGTPAQKIDKKEVEDILVELYPPGINSLSPIAIPNLPAYAEGDSYEDMVRKVVAHFLT